MGVEILGADVTVVPVKDGIEGDKDFENKEEKQETGSEGIIEPIRFGSHGMDIPVKGEGEVVTNANLPKDAVDDWPEPKKIHYFYLVKFRPYEDPKLKIKIEHAEKEIQKMAEARFQLMDSLKEKRSERAEIIAQLKPLSTENKRYRTVIDDRRKEMEPLSQALGKLRSANTGKGERGIVICSSEEELNHLIRSRNHQIEHESNTLAEEKLILKEIKQLEGTRDRVIANAAMKAKIQDSLGQKEAIQEQVKLIGVDLDGVRKEQQTVRTNMKNLQVDRDTLDKEISLKQQALEALNEKRTKLLEGLGGLRKQRDEGNAYFYQNKSLLNNAKTLAAKKDVAALEELTSLEVEKFMSLWNGTKSFRTEYEKRILQSLDMRQLSRDARMRNPDEKLLVQAPVAPAAPAPVEVAKPNLKRAKEDPKPSPQREVLPARKVQKEDGKKSPETETVTKIDDIEDKENNKSSAEKAPKEPPVIDAVDAAKLKEMKREEEIAKAKLALERKKKLAEKAAAKAAIRAQKEAEKKLKEREKKAKKKAGSSANEPEEPTEPEEEEVEPEKAAAVVDVVAPAPSKPRERKDSSTRGYRRGRGQDSLPKAILKRKKSTPYWVWAAPAAVLLVILLALGYYYLL